MGKALVIVESPHKAKVINGFLGSSYIVRASVGHIRDLPSSSSTTKTAKKSTGTAKTPVNKQQALFERMGVDPLNNWKANYEIMPDKTAVVRELKDLASEVDSIYLATDLDREGEAIAWHLQEILKKSAQDTPFFRIKYPEITKSAITKALANPGVVDMDKVNAQQTRRFLDRVVGFMVSPLLWEKVGRGLSAGRVQSVAVELVVDREREIKRFIPEEYWTISVDTNTPKEEVLTLNLATKGKSKVNMSNAQEANAVTNELRNQKFVVSKIESKQGKASPPPPFTTSTLQQSANQRLGFSVKRTMTVAQRLYESGFITYMRTDSVNLSQEAIDAARDIIQNDFGPKYLPAKPNVYQSKQSAQEAHEAIRPSHPNMATLPSTIDRDGQRLYSLIYSRYVACQMTEQIYETRTITVEAGDYILRASGRTELFDGFRAMLGGQTDDAVLPDVSQGDVLSLEKINPSRHFTQPPARFSEASLVRELEKDGVGRPSTYASIIATIQDRGYVKIERNRFFATKMGEIVTDRLRFSFANLMDVKFTANMEENLDEIAEGKRNWIKSLDDFFDDFQKHLAKAQLPAENGGMPNNRSVEINMPCPKCGKYNMAIHSGRTGSFLSCLGYSDTNVKLKDRCRCTVNLVPVKEQVLPEGAEMDEALETKVLLESTRCPCCGSTMDAFLIDKHRKLYVCSNSPTCNGYRLAEGDFSEDAAWGPTCTCEKCGSEMVQKEGRFGKYMLCTNDECKNTRKILSSGDIAPPREDPVEFPEIKCDKNPESHYVLRDGASGIFFAANNFPKVRETRPVRVQELKTYRERLSPKFYYLADAPAADPEGNPTEVRFSRKTKEQYIVSMLLQENGEAKQTNWAAYYDSENKVWNQTTLKARATKSASTDKPKRTVKKKAASAEADGEAKPKRTRKKAE